MVDARKVCLIAIALTTLRFLLSAQGKEIAVRLNDGVEMEHIELIAVRDSALVVSVVSSEMGALDTASLKLIKTRDIQEVLVKGESGVLSGMGVGFAIGGGLGVLVGLASGDDKGGFFRFSSGEKALVLGTTFGAAGVLIGLVAGAASSTQDRTVSPLPKDDLSVLKPYARYPRREPFFLNAIQ